MSKRVRGPARPRRRPGTRAASDRPVGSRRQAAAAIPAIPPQTAEPTAEAVIQDKAVAPAAEIDRASRAVHPRQRVKPGSVLAARAATEYVYVAQDMRRILIVAAALFGVLLTLWLLIIFLRVIELPFY